MKVTAAATSPSTVRSSTSVPPMSSTAVMPGEQNDGQDRLLPRRLVVLVRLTQGDEHLARAPQRARHAPPPDADEVFARRACASPAASRPGQA